MFALLNTFDKDLIDLARVGVVDYLVLLEES
jgi:hypothetical protein